MFCRSVAAGARFAPLMMKTDPCAAYPGGHYLAGTATSNLASACLAAKELTTAEKLFREAVRIFNRTLSAGHLNTGIARVKLGRTLLRQKRYQEAQAEV